MLGIAMINEIVMNKEITTPNLVLEELRIQIKNTLNQTGRKGERQEGMDVAFCAIDLESMTMSFSGAHNPLWLFRQVQEKEKKANEIPFEFIELPADHQSVSIGFNEKPFTEHKVQLETGDVFYLFTDGYASQFGNNNGETFKSKRFKELLGNIFHLPMERQKNILEKTFNDWKGTMPQIDDVLVIGVKV
jgi:serine phosphatase RsbU (regulator of sigma subunit)